MFAYTAANKEVPNVQQGQSFWTSDSPILVAYPIALYTATLVAFLIYLFVGDIFWFKVAVAASVGGVVMAAKEEYRWLQISSQ
jgi:hypothetical protein